MKNSISKQFKEGIITNNPTLVQFLGLCPALAVTTSVINAVGMGAAVTVVLIFSNLVISLSRQFVPEKIQIPFYLVIIAGFVTAAELFIKAFFPALSASLGLFVPLIAVNCMILGRAEAFASKNKPTPSVIDGIVMGIGFTLALVLVAFVRELLGTGTLFAAADGTGGIRVFGDSYSLATIFLLPSGAFLTLGFIAAAFQKISVAAEKKAKAEVTAEEITAEEEGEDENE